jgi:HK97 family phage major capsid protein
MPVDETHGTATDASAIVMGDFRELWLGIRLQLRIEVLKERYADNLQMGFLAWLRADIQLAHPESFAKITGIIP